MSTGSKMSCLLYFDEFLAERIVESMNEHPVWPSKILNKAKYKKFCLKYSAILGNKVTETQKTGKVQADTSANITDITAGEKDLSKHLSLNPQRLKSRVSEISWKPCQNNIYPFARNTKYFRISTIQV